MSRPLNEGMFLRSGRIRRRYAQRTAALEKFRVASRMRARTRTEMLRRRTFCTEVLMRKSIHRASLAALVIGAVAAASPAAWSATRRVEIRSLSGSGDYSDWLARSDGEPGAQVYASHHLDWAIPAKSRRRILTLPAAGAGAIAVPLRVHIVSTGGGTYFDAVASPPQDVAYTCTGEATHRTRATVRAKARRGGWKLRLRAIKRFAPGAPECTDTFAEDYFTWGTGGDWLAEELVGRASLPRAATRDATVEFANDPPPHDCTDVPGITPACTADLAWTAKLHVARP
jgi:hypothetical protein